MPTLKCYVGFRYAFLYYTKNNIIFFHFIVIIYLFYFLICSPTLFVGEHQHGLYALPSLVGGEKMALSLTKESKYLLLEGPHSDLNDTDEIVLILG